jgi:hypothetical protein
MTPLKETLRELPVQVRIALQRELDAIDGDTPGHTALDEAELEELLKSLRVRNRVVITGMGAVTPLALNVEETWAGLIEGRSGIDLIAQIDVSNYPTRIGGEVKGATTTL